MEKFRDTLKLRIRIGALYCALMLFPNVVLNQLFGGEPFTHFIMGVLTGIEAVIIIWMLIYTYSLKNEGYLRKLYIKEKDERRRLIRTKSGSTGVNIVIAGLLLAMMISGFFNKVVFFTLFGVEIFIAIVLLLVKLYYSRKI